MTKQRDSKKRKAPKVAPPSREKPNYMQESDKMKNKGELMSKKKLSK